MVKKQRLPGLCVFCGRAGVTKQHVWPQWLQRLKPEVLQHQLQNVLWTTSHPQVAVIKPELKFPRGPIHSRTVRRVCGPCNGGWISRIENDAKPFISTLVLGERTTLTRDNAARLAAWACLFCVVAEYTDEKSQAIPKEDRDYLRDTREAPGHWHIWIGNYKGELWKQRYKHAANLRRRLSDHQLLYGAHHSTFTFGAMIVHAASSTPVDGIRDFDELGDGHLTKIWPPSAATGDVLISGDVFIDDDLAAWLSTQQYYEGLGPVE